MKDQDGREVWGGNENCRDVKKESCELQEVVKEKKYPKYSCETQEEIQYSKPSIVVEQV